MQNKTKGESHPPGLKTQIYFFRLFLKKIKKSSLLKSKKFYCKVNVFKTLFCPSLGESS